MKDREREKKKKIMKLNEFIIVLGEEKNLLCVLKIFIL